MAQSHIHIEVENVPTPSILSGSLTAYVHSIKVGYAKSIKLWIQHTSTVSTKMFGNVNCQYGKELKAVIKTDAAGKAADIKLVAQAACLLPRTF